MIVWSGYHHDKRMPITIEVEYDEDLDCYIVEVTRGMSRLIKTFAPKYEPKDGLIHVSDLEKSVKLADVLIKELKKDSQRRKK